MQKLVPLYKSVIYTKGNMQAGAWGFNYHRLHNLLFHEAMSHNFT